MKKALKYLLYLILLIIVVLGGLILYATISDYKPDKETLVSESDAADVIRPDKELSFLPINSQVGQEYYQAMNFCQEFAQANRALMMTRFMKIFKHEIGGEFIDINKDNNSTKKWIWIHHNYASKEKHFGEFVYIHRKGATKAFKNQLGIVPGSMGTPSYIVEGLGNPESFMSCAHGAGRAMGRKEANRRLSREEADRAIKGIIFEGWRGKFDEAPQAYKNIELIIEQQKDLAKPIVKLKPLAVMMGN